MKLILKAVELYVPVKDGEKVDETKVVEVSSGWGKRLVRNLDKYKKTREGIEKFLATPKKEKKEKAVKQSTK